jgi:Xaa-Pro aminopeptidase
MSNKITQADVDKAADAELRACGGEITKVVANKVARSLGLSNANGAFYAKFESWKERRIAAGIGHISSAPPQLAPEIDGVWDGLKQTLLGLAGKAIIEKIEKHERERDILIDENAKGEVRETKLHSEIEGLRSGKAAAEKALTAAQAQLAASRHETQRVQAQLDESRKNHDSLMERLVGGQSVAPKPKRAYNRRKIPNQPMNGEAGAK